MFSTIEQKRYGNDCYDYIYLRNLHLSAAIGKDAWDRAGKAQPAILSLRLQRKVSHAAASDKLEDTTSYGQICKDVMTWVALEKTYADLFEFASHMHYLALSKEWGGTSLQMRTMLPKGSLKAEGGIGFEVVGTMDGEGREIVESSMRFVVNDLKIACIIGVNAHERLAKQTVIVNLQITQDSARVLHVPGSHREHWRGLIEDVTHVSLYPLIWHALMTLD